MNCRLFLLFKGKGGYYEKIIDAYFVLRAWVCGCKLRNNDRYFVEREFYNFAKHIFFQG